MKPKHILFILVAVVLTWNTAHLFARLRSCNLELALQRAKEEINALHCMFNQFQYQ